jgi:phosphopantothenoylcysteine decarboxylase/phosphopantothenate--cysteine ligase
MRLEGRQIILGVTGSIAAYKACDVLRRLKAEGADVRVVMTESACHLVGPTTFRSLSGAPVAISMFDGEHGGDLRHISLSEWAEIVVVAPATANILGKVAHGIADDLLSTTIMATEAPAAFAPAMNYRMWRNATVQDNVERLRALAYHFWGPEEGRLASGAIGVGRMAEPAAIVEGVVGLLAGGSQGAGLRVLVTAGPTREFIDPVRFISNPSTGRMGYAVAAAAQQSGAEVTLVSGPTHLAPPPGVSLVPVVSAQEMRDAVLGRVGEVDVVIGVAAVGDFAPAEPSDSKLKRGAGPLTLDLQATGDIMGEVGQKKGSKVLIGFAAETEDGETHAARKLQEKNLDLIVLNDIGEPGSGFAVETNRATLIRPGSAPERLPLMAKTDLAQRIWREALELVAQTRPRQ